jgi:hypothetical protein
MTRFSRIELRTSTIPEATEFYRSLLGTLDLSIVALPKEAQERGAPSHWLGYLGVDHLESTIQLWEARGAVLLSQIHATNGSRFAIVRDPGGAVLGLGSPADEAARLPVQWQILNCSRSRACVDSYCELFGWQVRREVETDGHGLHRIFAWNEGSPECGTIADIYGREGVHSHWLFFFAVTDLNSAISVVRKAGGLVKGPFDSGLGSSIAVCDDPQGAAFGLWENQC